MFAVAVSISEVQGQSVISFCAHTNGMFSLDDLLWALFRHAFVLP